MTWFLGKLGRPDRLVGLVFPVLIGAVTMLVSISGPARSAVPIPTGRTSTSSISDDRVQNETLLYQLLTPALRVAAKPEIQYLVRGAAGRMFDGDTNVLFSDLIQEAEGAGVINDSDQDWIEMKDALVPFQNVNGYPYEPQIYIPNYELGVMPSASIEMAVAPADESIGSVTGYWLDYIGYVQPTAVPIDAEYLEAHEVWVLSVNARADTGPPVLQSEKILPRFGPSSMSDVNVACNPTGLRNNMGLEYLQRWRVPNPSQFGGAFSGKPHMRLIVITVSGGMVKRATMDKVAKRHIDQWQTADMFLTTWDRALYGNVLAYQWLELDGGKRTTTMTVNIPIEGGGSVQTSVQMQEDDDDAGLASVIFSESTFQTYDTGSVQFNPCTVGGEGGTGFDNVACGALASASSTHSDYRVWRATDCDTNTALPYAWSNRRGTDPRTSLQWVQADFGVNRTVVRAVVYTSEGYPIRAFDIQVWTGTSYLTVGSVTNNTDLVIAVPFSTPMTTRLVRLVGRSGPLHQPQYVRVNELEVYGV